MIGLSWIFALNIVVNSALSFYTTILLIEGCVYLFRVTNPRIKAICRILPFCKICLDLCLYHFSGWALLHGMNPVVSEQGSRQLSLLLLNPFTGIQLSMQEGKTFSMADLIALSIDPIWVQGIVLIAGLGSISFSLLYLKRISSEKREIATMLAGATPLSLNNLHSSPLQVRVTTSETLSSPCIVGKVILFPSPLLPVLSKAEIEAIIVHERAHFRWKDCWVRITCGLIASLFWWIPTRWWQKRVEEAQEHAADAAIHKEGIPGTVLAGAILKTAVETKRSLLAFSFAGNGSLLGKRMGLLLNRAPTRCLGWRVVQYGLLFSAAVSISLGTLWIF